MLPNSLQKNTFFPLIVLLFLTFSIFIYPMFQSEFLNWDDDLYLTENAPLQSEDAFYQIWVAGKNPNPYPITFSVIRLELMVFGMNSFGFHLVNLTFHLFNIILFWHLLTKLNLTGITRWLPVAFYALHPVQVESVMWMSEIKNLLSAFFYWLSFFAFLKFFIGPPKKWLFYGIGIFTFILSLLSKSMTVTLPVSLTLWLLCWERDKFLKQFLPLIPLYFISIFSGVLSLKSEGHYYVADSARILQRTLFERIYDVIEALIFYLSKLFAPFSLSCVYPYHPFSPPYTLKSYFILFAFLGLIGVLFLFFRRFKSKSLGLILFSLLNYVIVAGPILGFITTSYMPLSKVADRYHYHSLPFLVLGFTLIFQEIGKKYCAKFKKGFLVLGVFLGFGLLFQTFQYSMVWTNSTRLWEQASSVALKQSFVHEYLGKTYWDKGDLVQAEKAYKKAVEADPNYYLAKNNYANFLVMRGNVSAAAQLYREVLEVAPDLGVAYSNLGHIYYANGEEKKALVCYEKALKAKSSSNLGLFRLGTLYLKQNEKEKGLKYFKLAIEANIEPALAHQKLAFLLAENFVEAERHLITAIKLRPKIQEFKMDLYRLYVQHKMHSQAYNFLEDISSQPPDALYFQHVFIRYLLEYSEKKDYLSRAFLQIQQLQKQVKSQFEMSQVLELLAIAHYKKNEPLQAIKTIRKAFSLVYSFPKRRKELMRMQALLRVGAFLSK